MNGGQAMRKLLWVGLVLLYLAPASVTAQSVFDGTWKIDLSKAQFSKKPDVYLLQNGMWQCETCVPAVNIKADGRDYKVPNDDPCLGTLSVRVVDDRTVEGANKGNGKITNTWKATLSPDGNALSFENRFTCNAKSEPITTREEYTRVAKGPAGSHAISGSWAPVEASASENDLGETWKVEGDKVRYSDSTGQSFVAKLDGTYTAVTGDPSHSLASVKLEGKNTLVETVKLKGKVTSIIRMTVAPDDKTMSIVITDTQRGTTDERVVAEKQ
jgi:hypothetical protein